MALIAILMLCASCGGEQIAAPRAEERPAGDSLQADHLEDEVVCGAWTETYLTILWRFLAGGSDASRVAGLAGVERVSFVTADQRGLGGYRLRAYADPSRPPRGYVLIGLGNAMLADQVVGEFTFLQADGFDVYVYDHRGYGISEGKSRFAAILSDYIALIEHLNGQGYPSRLLYGMSLGGIFMLNAIGAGVGYDAVLIDSPPSRISDYGCPARLDPVANVPEDASRLGFIFGHRDKVVPPGAWRELAALARARGASVMERAELAHPLMDRTPSAHRARMAILRAFFTERAR